MTLEQIFSICSTFAMVGWILLMVAPRWRWTERLIIIGVWPALLSVVYLILIVVHFGTAEGGFGSLAEVSKLFESKGALLAGWVHYLAFDLLIGAFEVKKAKEERIPHLLIIPSLVLTFFLGPIGFLLFVLTRSIRNRRFAGVE